MELVLTWVIVGVLLMVAEIFTAGFVVIFFGIGAVLTGALMWAFPGLGETFLAQALVFLALSVASLVAGRRFFCALRGKSERGTADADDDGIVGAQVEVVAAIAPPLAGKVVLNGVEWEAVAERPVKKGETVPVIARKGIVLVVR